MNTAGKNVIFSQYKKRFEKIINRQIIIKALYYKFLCLSL